MLIYGYADTGNKDRLHSICNTQGYQRRICDGLEMKLICPLGGIQQAGVPKTASKSVTPIVFTCGH